MQNFNKIIYIPTSFKAEKILQTVKVSTGEFKRGFFGGEKEIIRKEEQWVPTGERSKSEIDGEQLSRDIAHAIRDLNMEGYEVTSITSITSGQYFSTFHAQEVEGKGIFHSGGDGKLNISGGGSYGLGYGYSYTEGVIILARRSDL